MSWLITFLIICVAIVIMIILVIMFLKTIQKAPEEIQHQTEVAEREADDTVELAHFAGLETGGLDLGGAGYMNVGRNGMGRYLDTVLLIPSGRNFVGVDRFQYRSMSRFRLFHLFSILLFGCLIGCASIADATPGSIRVTEVKTQIPCSDIIQVNCRVDDDKYHEVSVSVELPFGENVVFEESWLVVPFMRLDTNPGLKFCRPTLIQECLIVNNATAAIKIEFGSFRWSHVLYESPSLEFPFDYVLFSESINGTVNPNATTCPPSQVLSNATYTDGAVCTLGVCDCNLTIENSTITEMVPLLPACGLFNVKHLLPKPTTWANITIYNTNLTVRDNIFIPYVTPGMWATSSKGNFGIQIENFVVPQYPANQFPVRLDGGAVICDWKQQLNPGGELAGQVENPHLDPMDQLWYYTSDALISAEYRGHECGQNGVSSQEIYGYPAPLPFCCTNGVVPDYTQGACIPERPPGFMIFNKSPNGFPPFSRPGLGNYWVSSTASNLIQLLREPDVSEFPAAFGRPKIDLKLAVSDRLILTKHLGEKYLVAGGTIEDLLCNFEFKRNLGAISFSICNEALHASLPRNLSVSANCTVRDSQVNFYTANGTFRYDRHISPGTCNAGAISFYFDTPPFNSTSEISYFNPFDMRCNVELSLPLVGNLLDREVNLVQLHRLRTIDCSLYSASYPPLPPNQTKICDETDIACLINRDQTTTTGNPWGIVTMVLYVVLIIAIVVGVIIVSVDLSHRSKQNKAEQPDTVSATENIDGSNMSSDPGIPDEELLRRSMLQFGRAQQ